MIDDLLEIHREIDRAAQRLERTHRDRMRCGRGCHDCCVDDITVFEIEALRIRDSHTTLLRDDEPHPEGKCAFLDPEGACRIYDDRPYVCRTQGLPLRWMEDTSDGSRVEHRDICPLTTPGPRSPISTPKTAGCSARTRAGSPNCSPGSPAR